MIRPEDRPRRREATARAVLVAVCAALVAESCAAALAHPVEAQTQTGTVPPAPLSVDGVGDGATLDLTSNAPLFVHSFTVLSLSADQVGALTVVVEPFTDAQGIQTAATVLVAGLPNSGSTAIAVPALGTVPVSVSATLDEVGVYTSRMVLTAGSSRSTVTLHVTRTGAAPTVTVSPIGTVDEELEGGDVTVPVSVTMQETGNHEVALNKPTVVGLVRLNGTVPVQASYSSLTVLGLGSADTITLGPGEARTLTIALAGLSDAGQYTGSVRFSAPGALPVDAPFTVVIRRGWWLAAVLIFVGVVVSAGLQGYLGNRRVRLVNQRGVAVLQERLKGMLDGRRLDANTAQVAAELGREIQEVFAEAALDPTAVAGGISQVRGKLSILPEWLEEWTDALNLSQPPAAMLLLKQVEDFFMLDGAGDAELQAARQVLAQVEPALNVVRTQAAADTLQTTVAAWMSEMTPGEQQSQEVVGLKQLVDSAVAAASSGADGAGQAVWTAQHRWYGLLAGGLQAQVASAAAPPGLDDAAWADVRSTAQQAVTEVEQATNVQQASAAYAKGYTDVLSALIKGLTLEVQKRGTLPGIPGDEDQKVTLALEQASAALKAGNLRGAQASYASALAQFPVAKTVDYLVAEGARGGGGGGGALEDGRAAIAAAPANHMLGRATRVIHPRRSQPIPKVARLTALLGRYDLFVGVVLGVIAVVLGLTILWTPNQTWGSLEDGLIAILWGLGLHQVGTAAPFGGISGLRATFEGAQGPSGGAQVPPAPPAGGAGVVGPGPATGAPSGAIAPADTKAGQQVA